MSTIFRATARDSLIYMIPTLLTRGLGLIMLPIYARALTPEDYGVLDLIGVAGPMINVVLCLEVLQGLVRLRVDADSDEKRRMTGTAWIFSIGMYVVFLLAIIPNSELIARWLLGGSQWTGAVQVGAVSITLNCLVNVFLSQFRWELRSGTYSVVTCCYAALSIALAAWFALGLDAGIVGILFGQCISAGLTSVVTIFMVRESWTLAFDKTLLIAMLRFSWPLVPASLSVFISLYFNRLALAGFSSLHEVGIYGMGARLASFSTVLIAAMQGAVTPLVYAHYKDPETPASLARIFNVAVSVVLLTCVALHLASRELVLLLATPVYLDSAQLVPLLAPAMLMAQMYVFAPGMAIAKQTVRQLVVTAVGALVSIVANVLLVPPWGALGAAAATLLSAACFLALWGIMSQRVYPIPFGRGPLLSAVLCYLVFTAVTYFLIAQDLGVIVGLITKLAVLLAFAICLVSLGLIPLADIRRGVASLKR